MTVQASSNKRQKVTDGENALVANRVRPDQEDVEAEQTDVLKPVANGRTKRAKAAAVTADAVAVDGVAADAVAADGVAVGEVAVDGVAVDAKDSSVAEKTPDLMTDDVNSDESKTAAVALSATSADAVASTTRVAVPTIKGYWRSGKSTATLHIDNYNADGTFSGQLVVQDGSSTVYDTGTHPVVGAQDTTHTVPTFYMSVQWRLSNGKKTNSFTSWTGEITSGRLDTYWTRGGFQTPSGDDWFNKPV